MGQGGDSGIGRGQWDTAWGQRDKEGQLDVEHLDTGQSLWDRAGTMGWGRDNGTGQGQWDRAGAVGQVRDSGTDQESLGQGQWDTGIYGTGWDLWDRAGTMGHRDL